MLSKKTIRVLQIGCFLGVVPAIIWAHEYGPDPGFTNAPGDNPTSCVKSQCHVGTVNDPSFGGSLQIRAAQGTTYTPGVKQRIMVVLTDPARQSWGFEMTARTAQNGQAGSFTDTSGNTQGGDTQVICQSSNFAPCPSSTPLQWIEHSLAGWQASVAHKSSYTYQFDWTPPASAAGNVTLYAAGNASNSANTLSPNQNTGHIYSTSLVLAPAAAPPAGGTPSISAGGAISASAYGGFASAAPGSFVEIYGSNLAPASDSGGRTWGGADFTNGNAPTMLDGVTATIGGQAAYIEYVDPGHINVLLPANVGTGPQPLIVTVNGTASAPYSLTINATQPGLLAPPSFTVNGKQYLTAFHQDGTFVLPPGAIAGLTSSQAKPGEIVTLYGIGFGPVTPSSFSIAGTLFPGGTNQLALPLSLSVGGLNAVTPYFGLAPGFTGLYQFNVTIPQAANSDLVPVAFTLGGSAGTQTLYTAVHN